MISVVSLQFRRICGSSQSAWTKCRRPLGAALHSSDEPDELSHWQCHDDSTTDIVEAITAHYYYRQTERPRYANICGKTQQQNERKLRIRTSSMSVLTLTSDGANT